MVTAITRGLRPIAANMATLLEPRQEEIRVTRRADRQALIPLTCCSEFPCAPSSIMFSFAADAG
jgi:hypothetical protein